MTLVDSNVLIDFLADDPLWSEWSIQRLREAVDRGSLLINDVIYAEVSAGFLKLDDFEAALATIGVTVAPLPRAALFLAGKAFVQYRRAGGTRTGVLPDFFIGAHAEVESLTLLTRDPRKYQIYFPSVRLITPDLG
ncbi:type II toxin-antitoxin system VapC family toxin [Rhodopseudomonas palustris]|uniref:type II toxin-antitoxin system VapC family toxin n=1 Tax=Rhodopseudomonas palustris TaxID=1076 RepID=UPI002ACDEF34|nr:type II toxin-antitoxin system VapC family toxin [Rhodopseudomonas palustris]WQG98663.1 type II toxin-antitoxin system VapC family toxin [Rhodopseudomonas palustris]